MVLAVSRERGVELVDVYKKSINKKKFKLFLTRSAKSEKSERSERKLDLNQVKKVVCATGLVVKAPKARKAAGWTVMLLMGRAATSRAEDQREKRGQNIQHAVLPLVPVKNEAAANPGAKNQLKVKNNEFKRICKTLHGKSPRRRPN